MRLLSQHLSKQWVFFRWKKKHFYFPSLVYYSSQKIVFWSVSSSYILEWCIRNKLLIIHCPLFSIITKARLCSFEDQVYHTARGRNLFPAVLQPYILNTANVLISVTSLNRHCWIIFYLLSHSWLSNTARKQQWWIMTNYQTYFFSNY